MATFSNWKSLFYKRILERGKSYYDRGLVYDYHDDGDVISATVGQDNDYAVLIVYYGNEIDEIRCNCPYARGGYHCKHMAAVLYRHDEGEAGHSFKSAVPVLIRPFAKTDRKYFFDLDKAAERFDISASLYESALELARKPHDSKIELRYDNNGSPYLHGIFSLDGRIIVETDLAADRFLDLQCRDRRCFLDHFSRRYDPQNRHICIHELAALILLDEYIVNNDPGDHTNAAAHAFLERFPASAAEKAERIRDIRLYPRLDIGKDRLEASFKAGNDKVYVVKDLSHFVKDRRERQTYYFTAKGKLDFAVHDIAPQDEELFDFVAGCVRDEEQRKEELADKFRYRADSRVGSRFVLNGSRLDAFFALACADRIEVNDNRKLPGDKYEAELVEETPEFVLKLRSYAPAGDFAGLRLSGELPHFYPGARYDYYVADQKLCRVAKKDNGLTAFFPDQGPIDLIIGRKSLGHFYNHVLPVLAKMAQIDEELSEEDRGMIPPKAEFAFYLDVQNGEVCAVSDVKYGTNTFNLLDQGDRQGLIDRYSEEETRKVLEKAFRADQERKMHVADSDDDRIVLILEEVVPALMRLGDVHTTAAFDRLGRVRKLQLSVGVRIDSGLLELDIASDDVPVDELAGIVDSYRLKKHYYKLKDGQLLKIEEDSIGKLSLLLEEMGVSIKDLLAGHLDIPAYRALYLDELLSENDDIYEHRDEHFRQLLSRFQEPGNRDHAVPSGLEQIMRPYQKEGFNWLKTLSECGFGGILADEMGLGKSLQTIALLKDHKDRNGSGTSLIVCPSSLLYNWLAEITKFSPDLKAIAMNGTRKQRQKIMNSLKDYDVLVTSYGLLRRDIDLYEDCFFAYQILDEAQYIKTFSTANARSCKAIKAAHRFALTGTPIENNLSELWSIFDYLMPGFLYRYEQFRSTFENKIVSDGDEEAAARLKKMIAPFILRRRKTEVLQELPEKIEEIIKVRFADKQQKLYDSQVLKISDLLNQSDEERFRRSKIAILAELTKIRQICCEPSLLYADYDGGSAKKDACLELVNNAIDAGHKILIFSQFTSMLEVLENRLDEQRIAHYKITGKTKKEERLGLVEAFNKDETPVFLISLKAGGTGLNLTGADIVIHYDPWWNVAAQDQASDRAHRIGQEKIVTVYKIIADHSIEEKIVELQQKKADLIESVLSSENASLSSLSKEDLLELLK